MKSLVKWPLIIGICVAAIYYAGFFILPSVTVINKTNADIQSIKIILPDSGLDFGSVLRRHQNTIHYSLQQTDGFYKYDITNLDGVVRSGTCGYVTNNEIHKRVLIQITEQDVICDGGIQQRH
ncbi:hypothetical protein [Salinimonas chungwhensis]|uniref:hypothetical protein n=1 Tax=Salinimonas chungwhensis TaxID=265425 RepID=UPI00036D2FB9|nr:hypothetical protein [Salinimonas chungwhensis]